MLEPESGIRYLTPTAASGSFVAKLNTGAARNLADVDEATDIVDAAQMCKLQIKPSSQNTEFRSGFCSLASGLCLVSAELVWFQVTAIAKF